MVGGYQVLSVGIDIALIGIGHGRMDRVGLPTYPLDTGSRPWVRIQSHLSSGVVQSSDNGAYSSMTSKVPSSETAESVELDTRSVFSKYSDHQRMRACSITG